jgi:PAS domain S-box-containing protein
MSKQKDKKMTPTKPGRDKASRRHSIQRIFDTLGVSYETFFDCIKEGVFILDKNGHFVHVNDIIEQRSGIPLDKFVGLNFLNIVSPAYHEKVKKNFEKVMRGEEAPPVDFEYLRPDGTSVAIECNVMPLFRGDEVVAIVGTSRDMTERKRMEAALRESENEFRTAIESLPFDFFVINSEWRYIIQNSTIRERYGDIIGMRPEELDVDEETLELWQSNNRRAFAGEIVKEEVSFVVGGKRGFYYNIISPIYTDGQVRAIMGMNIDITERKMAELALARSRDELEERVAQRTADLKVKTKELEELNSALRVLLKRRDKDKSDFEGKVLSNVKDLVAPYVEKLKRSSLTAKEMTYLKILESNLNDIVSPFVQHLSSKYSVLTPTEIQIAQLIKEGKATKEIAELLSSSKRTVESHRENIRIKLGLKHKKVNLRSFLSSV